MSTISNFNFYTYTAPKKAEAKKEGQNSPSSESKAELIENKNIADTSKEDKQYFVALAYDYQNSYSNYIMISSQPLNNTLTKYRDTYPGVIGFTAKTQSSLNSLCREYTTKLCGLTSKFANCKTQEDFDKCMAKLKDEVTKVMKEYEAKFNNISAIVSAIPELNDIQSKGGSTDINMHDELESILKGVTSSDSKKTDINKDSTKTTDDKLDKTTIISKKEKMESKKAEYQKKLNEAKQNSNQTEIMRNENLINGAQKLIDVYSVVLNGFDAITKK